jgi:hypothetical protein
MNLLRHRRERLALKAENDNLRDNRDWLLEQLWQRNDEIVCLRAELNQAEAELRALTGEVA